jgi:hypothetical protein
MLRFLKWNNHRPFERMDFCSLRGFLQANPFEIDTDTDVDTLCESFVAYFKAACYESGTTIIKRRALREWIDEEFLALVRAKRYWWKKHLGDKDNDLIKVEYKLSLNRVTSAKKVKGINFFSRKFHLGDGSPRQVWKERK